MTKAQTVKITFKYEPAIPTDNLIPNDWNPNEMSPQTFERLRKEIREQGFKDPLYCRPHPKQEGKYEIIDGENRWRAGMEEGMTHFPCLIDEINDWDEATFRTYMLNNLKGEINEVKLAVLVQNWREKGLGTSVIFTRTGIRAHKQKALLSMLRPRDVSEGVLRGSKGQHKSFAVILSNDEYEILHRAIKLTRLHKDVDSVLELAEYYLEHHDLTNEQQALITKLLTDKDAIADAQGLVDIASFYLANVTKEEIRTNE